MKRFRFYLNEEDKQQGMVREFDSFRNIPEALGMDNRSSESFMVIYRGHIRNSLYDNFIIVDSKGNTLGFLDIYIG